MKTEVCIFNLRGNFAAIREYANTIASMSASASNAYVMAFDKDDEITWVIQAGDDLDEVKAAINWHGVRRVEIYDHSADGQYKTEQVYITSQKSLDAYTSERNADEYDVTCNRTACTACNWQAAEPQQQQDNNNDTQNDESDDTNEDTSHQGGTSTTGTRGAATSHEDTSHQPRGHQPPGRHLHHWNQGGGHQPPEPQRPYI